MKELFPLQLENPTQNPDRVQRLINNLRALDEGLSNQDPATQEALTAVMLLGAPRKVSLGEALPEEYVVSRDEMRTCAIHSGLGAGVGTRAYNRMGTYLKAKKKLPSSPLGLLPLRELEILVTPKVNAPEGELPIDAIFDAGEKSRKLVQLVVQQKRLQIEAYEATLD